MFRLRKKNTEADKASRVDKIDIKWELSSQAFKEISKRFGEMKVDLFATRENFKCKYFCSWHTDLEAFCIGVFCFFLNCKNLKGVVPVLR